jgi:hypothetical protein
VEQTTLVVIETTLVLHYSLRSTIPAPWSQGYCRAYFMRPDGMSSALGGCSGSIRIFEAMC